MLVSEQTNSSSVKKNSTFMETVQDKLKDIKNFSNWSAKEQIVAVGAVGVMVGVLVPFVAVALPVAAIGAIVALTLFFAVKAVEYIFKGLKWSAEKTVDGAKYTAGKIRDGAVHATDKIKSSTSHVVHNVAQSLDRLSSRTNYSDAMLNSQLLSGDAKGKIVGIKEQLMGIFNNEEIANKDKLLKKILKDIVLQIESKKNHAQGTDSEKYVPEWDKQINFIKNLNAEKLHDLLTKQSLLKDTYFLYTIFSEHHDKVERIVKQCKTEHRLSNVVENLNKVAGKYGIRKGATQSIENSLSRSSSLDSVRTDSTVSSEAELLNPAKHKKVKQSSGFFSRVKRNEPLKEATDIKYQAFSEPDTSSRQVGGSTFYVAPPKPPRSNSLNSIGTVSTATVSSSDSKDFATVNPNRLSRSSSSSCLTPKLTPVASPKLSRSSSTDSGFNSSISSPTHTMFTNGNDKPKTQNDLKKTGRLDELVRQQEPAAILTEAHVNSKQSGVTV
ncbi:MAG: hypothetical protein LBE46_04035 [Wolbachia pipientis]|jgi:hypothetical protein|nr:hypothetical protein [Wolbachia pipientis]